MAFTDLLWCNQHESGTPLVVSGEGASNLRGKNATTGNPAAHGKTMPAGCTLYEENTTPLTSYTTDHFGFEVGLMDRLKNFYSFPDPIVVVKWGIEGSSMNNWNGQASTDLIALYATTGYPNANLFTHGGSPAGVGGGFATYEADILTMIGIHRRVRGHGLAWIVSLFKSMDLVEYPNTVPVQTAQRNLVGYCQGTKLLDTTDNTRYPMDSTSHFLGEAQLNIGYDLADLLIANRIISV